jgi:hypothetical protein
MAKQLSDIGVDAIKENPELYAAVAEALDIAPQSLPPMLSKKKRPRRLMEFLVVKLIADKKGVEPETLIVEKDADVVLV